MAAAPDTQDDPLEPRNCSHRPVHGVVVAPQPHRRHPRRPAPRQLHRFRPRGDAASTCSITAASAFSRRNSSTASSTLSRPPARHDDLVVHAYETWGFDGLSRADRHAQHLGALHLRAAARRPRPHHRRWRHAGGYGRREAFRVKQALQAPRPGDGAARVRVHGARRDRLGAVFLHLRAEVNLYRLFNEAIERFSLNRVDKRQADALAAVGL